MTAGSFASAELVYGIHAVMALLRQPAHMVYEVYQLVDRKDKRIQAVLDLAAQRGIPVRTVSRSVLDGWVEVEASHQGIAAKATLKHYSEGDLVSLLTNHTQPIDFILALDEVQDPHNLGACLRTADAAGVQLVLAPKRNAAPITATVRKIACGAAEAIPYIQVTNLARTLRLLQQHQFWLYGLDGNAQKTLYQADLKGKLVLILGAEGTGLRQLTRTHCDELLAIPQLGSVSSLNVSVAAGVCLFEVVRQRTSNSR